MKKSQQLQKNDIIESDDDTEVETPPSKRKGKAKVEETVKPMEDAGDDASQGTEEMEAEEISRRVASAKQKMLDEDTDGEDSEGTEKMTQAEIDVAEENFAKLVNKSQKSTALELATMHSSQQR